MNLAGVSEDFGPHSRSVVLYACQIFFYEKFLWTDFFSGARLGIFFTRGSENFWQKILSGISDNGAIFLSDVAQGFFKKRRKIFKKTHKNFWRRKEFFLRRKEKFFFETHQNFFETRRNFFKGTRGKIFLKNASKFLETKRIFWWTE